MPLVRPETVIGDAPVPVNPPGDEVAVYVADPAVPVAPAVYATVAEALPPVAEPIVGADGPTPMTSEGLTADEGDSTPVEEIATTVNVLVVPAVIPLTTIGLEFPVAV